MGSRVDYLAIDLGASSGRAVLGAFDGDRLVVREVHRFPNGPIQRPTGLHWDARRLFSEVQRSISLAQEQSPNLGGIGIDTWGVDYALLSATGELLALPHHYRDARTNGLMKQAFARVQRERIYARTGIQFLPFNTIYQLLADQAKGTLANARHLLFMPDLLNFWLTGVMQTERSMASTSQLYDPKADAWAMDLISDFGLPARIFPPIAAPGARLGPLLPSQTQDCRAVVIAPGSHDTASAVAAVPARGLDWAYVSSGTWSLVGRELTQPITSAEALAANFTNECGLEGTLRFHKNIAGMWLLQECSRAWANAGRAIEMGKLLELAGASPPFVSLIDPDDEAFAQLDDDMPKRVQEYCRRTDQPPPQSEGAVVRCILESLALKTAVVLNTLERLTGPIRVVHVVGGGVQNPLLLQFTADAAARPVLAGPVEATAIGNVLCQALSLRQLDSLQSLRKAVQASFPPREYLPSGGASWKHALHRLHGLIQLKLA